jgi:hypothetical protein
VKNLNSVIQLPLESRQRPNSPWVDEEVIYKEFIGTLSGVGEIHFNTTLLLIRPLPQLLYLKTNRYD